MADSRIEHPDVMRISGIAQHRALAREHEPRRRHFGANTLGIDAMERLGVAQSRACLGGVIDDEWCVRIEDCERAIAAAQRR